MQTISIDVQDSYVDKILDFLKLLPQDVIKINEPIQNEDYDEEELLNRVEEIKSQKVEPITREELFHEL